MEFRSHHRQWTYGKVQKQNFKEFCNFNIMGGRHLTKSGLGIRSQNCRNDMTIVYEEATKNITNVKYVAVNRLAI